MKTIISKGLLVAICAMYFLGCVETQISQGPTCLNVSGIIINEEGLPLEGIRVSVDTTLLERNNWWFGIDASSDKEGKYSLTHKYKGDAQRDKDWPTEVSVIAKDASGMYETQIERFSVETRERTLDKGDVDGIVTANFIMHKK